MSILFSIKDTKLYLPIVTFSAKDNQKLSKFFSKGFQRLVYWNEYQTKSENKNKRNAYSYFLESNFVAVNRLLVYSNQYDNSQRFKAKKYSLPKSIIDNYNVFINGKNLYGQATDSDIK